MASLPLPGAAVGTTASSSAVMACADCGLDGGPFPTVAEAGHLAAIHNDLHHGGHPVAAACPISTAVDEDYGAAWIDLVDDTAAADDAWTCGG